MSTIWLKVKWWIGKLAYLRSSGGRLSMIQNTPNGNPENKIEHLEQVEEEEIGKWEEVMDLDHVT